MISNPITKNPGIEIIYKDTIGGLITLLQLKGEERRNFLNKE